MQLQQVASRSGQFRGVWQTGIQYNVVSLVQDGVNGNDTQNYYLCVIANVSGVWSTDLANGDWSLVVNVQQILAAEAAAVCRGDCGSGECSNGHRRSRNRNYASGHIYNAGWDFHCCCFHRNDTGRDCHHRSQLGSQQLRRPMLLRTQPLPLPQPPLPQDMRVFIP